MKIKDLSKKWYARKWKSWCRTCIHYHYDGYDKRCTAGKATKTWQCPCMKYTPADNLEYLEYLYEKKS